MFSNDKHNILKQNCSYYSQTNTVRYMEATVHIKKEKVECQIRFQKVWFTMLSV